MEFDCISSFTRNTRNLESSHLHRRIIIARIDMTQLIFNLFLTTQCLILHVDDREFLALILRIECSVSSNWSADCVNSLVCATPCRIYSVMSELICQRDGWDGRAAPKQESVSKGRLRLNLLYDRSSKGSWRWRTVCDSERTSKSSSLPREFGPQLLRACVPPLLYTWLTPTAEFSGRACARTCGLIIISVLRYSECTDHHTRGPHTAASFLFALVKLSFLGSYAANHFVRTLARLRLLTECSLITMSGGFDSSLMERRQPPSLPFPSITIICTINTWIELHISKFVLGYCSIFRKKHLFIRHM